MYDDIIDNLNSTLSLEELGDIVKKSLSLIYCKLENDGMYNPYGVIKSLGRDDYDVEVIFVNNRACNTGKSYEEMYYL